MSTAKPTKILFVDDEPDIEVLMKQKFRRDIKSGKFEFHFAQNGFKALEKLNTVEEIWLVVSDINMPEMDGLTLLKEINVKHPNVIAVIVSAYGDMSNIRQAMNLGAFDFVTKPINFDDFNKTIEKTMRHIEHLLKSSETTDRLESILVELNVAANIQHSILPKDFIDDKYVQLYADMRAAKHIGGDFYDFFYLDKEQNQLAIIIADVSGKGIPAALFMTVTRTLIHAKAPEFPNSPGKCLAEVNSILEADNENMMFVTMFYAILNKKTGELIYSNGGHNPPYITHANGSQTILNQTHGMALGVDECNYKESTTTLNYNDVLFLYTDGVTEAENINSECYGEERLVPILVEQHNLAAKDLVLKIEEEINKFAVGHIQSDDITTLACKYLGGKHN
jgi:sigma-B regulation protein RsbU (phosphoserine phosphatase)